MRNGGVGLGVYVCGGVKVTNSSFVGIKHIWFDWNTFQLTGQKEKEQERRDRRKGLLERLTGLLIRRHESKIHFSLSFSTVETSGDVSSPCLLSTSVFFFFPASIMSSPLIYESAPPLLALSNWKVHLAFAAAAGASTFSVLPFRGATHGIYDHSMQIGQQLLVSSQLASTPFITWHNKFVLCQKVVKNVPSAKWHPQSTPYIQPQIKNATFWNDTRHASSEEREQSSKLPCDEMWRGDGGKCKRRSSVSSSQ